MKKILVIPKLKIHNANALSSPYTIGFPAMTAWMGGTHAIERQLKQRGFDRLSFNKVRVVCHKIDLQTYKGDGEFVHSIIGTGNPLDKFGKRPSFIEEGRCHLCVSLVIEYQGIGGDDIELLPEQLSTILHSSAKMASGDIMSFESPFFITINNENDLRKLARQLMPGHCLIERRDLMIEAMKDGQDAIDALLDYLMVTYRYEQEADSKTAWAGTRKESGWIIPIATGFQGVSKLGKAESQRDPDSLHRFAESIITLGEFIMPYRITDVDQILWHYHVDLENNLYLCQQNKPDN